jgi:3D (Asp-Asp-Asp) domain-containing protein
MTLNAPVAEAGVKETRATCYNLRGTTASGTYVDRRTAAHNFLLPGTRIRIVGRRSGPGGVRRYVVRDTGSALWDGHFDLWAPDCSGWDNPTLKWRLGW